MNDVAFSPDGHDVLTGSNDKTALIHHNAAHPTPTNVLADYVADAAASIAHASDDDAFTWPRLTSLAASSPELLVDRIGDQGLAIAHRAARDGHASFFGHFGPRNADILLCRSRCGASTMRYAIDGNAVAAASAIVEHLVELSKDPKRMRMKTAPGPNDPHLLDLLEVEDLVELAKTFPK